MSTMSRPALREGPRSFAQQAISHPAKMTPRLLLIDDDSRLASMVGDYLGRAGFAVDTAGSLAAGRERLAAASYDAAGPRPDASRR